MESMEDSVCVLCTAKFHNKEELQDHFRKHANREINIKGRNGTCGDEDVHSMKINTKISEKDKIPCDLCPMNFLTVTQAIQHKYKKHSSNSVKYHCEYCGMQFPIKYTRDKHLILHQNETKQGSFPCPDCGIQFYTNEGCEYHNKSIHKRVTKMFQPINTPPPSKKIKINNLNEVQSVYYCHLCGSEYVVKFNLQKHLEKSHPADVRDMVPENLIKCTTCEALFYNKKAYDTHILCHKPDDLYVVNEEQRLKTVTRIDQDFDIRRVQLSAEKFIPVYKPVRRSQTKKKQILNIKTENSDDELSPVTDSESSESEDESKSDNILPQPKKILKSDERKISEKCNLLQNRNVEKEENINLNLNTKKTRDGSAQVIENNNSTGVKKHILYAVLNSDGTIKSTSTVLPKNVSCLNRHKIKLKASDIKSLLIESNKSKH